MDEGARLWLAKTARRNYWRVSRWFDLEDLIQEGCAIYYETVRRYPNANDPRHRMALFKVVFTTRLHDMANKRTLGIDEVCVSDLFSNHDPEYADQAMERFVAEPGMLEAVSAFANAPKYVMDAMTLFTTDLGLRRLRSGYRKIRSGKHLKRETLNERLCRLTGYDPARVDIVGGIRACLEG